MLICTAPHRGRRATTLGLPHLTDPACDSVQSGCDRVARLTSPICASMRVGHSIRARGTIMNNIVYIVGLVVIVLFILGFFGLR